VILIIFEMFGTELAVLLEELNKCLPKTYYNTNLFVFLRDFKLFRQFIFITSLGVVLTENYIDRSKSISRKQSNK